MPAPAAPQPELPDRLAAAFEPLRARLADTEGRSWLECLVAALVLVFIGTMLIRIAILYRRYKEEKLGDADLENRIAPGSARRPIPFKRSGMASIDRRVEPGESLSFRAAATADCDSDPAPSPLRQEPRTTATQNRLSPGVTRRPTPANRPETTVWFDPVPSSREKTVWELTVSLAQFVPRTHQTLRPPHPTQARSPD